MKVARALVAGFVTASIVLACSTTDSGRTQLTLLPESQMNDMGKSAYTDILAKEKISTNVAMTQAVREIGERIAKASGKDYEWEFNLFESDQVNAFCLPGGKIGVYTGILPYAKTNAGLAAVMGHEVAHATAQHSNERVSQQLLIYGVLIGAQAALEDEEYRGPLMAALGLGVQFGVSMPFSRKHETEADLIGLTYMARAGYDPREAASLWERMAGRGNAPPEWLSTHPNPNTRVEDIEDELPDVLPLYEESEQQATVNL